MRTITIRPRYKKVWMKGCLRFRLRRKIQTGGKKSNLCRSKSASLAVVGVSFLPGPSEFLSGLNSSSRAHSHTRKLSENCMQMINTLKSTLLLHLVVY